MKSPMTSERTIPSERQVMKPDFKVLKRVLVSTECDNILSRSLSGTGKEERGWSLVETVKLREESQLRQRTLE